MCFSASASLTAGVLLTFVGVETIKKVHKPEQIIFASLPVFFALQQFSEGILWMTMGHAGYGTLQTVVTYIFVAMAQILWPVMIPVSVLLIEENKIRKRGLAALMVLGSAIGLYNLYLLIAHRVHAEISGMHLIYQSNFDDNFGKAALACYLAVTIVPLFVSSIKRMYILGIIMAASFLVSAFFYMQCLTSVWCFFAAIISFVVYYIVRDAHKKFHFEGAGK
jgi:hypothetical protein